MQAEAQVTSRYHNRFLFDFSGREVTGCLRRLERQAELYAAADLVRRKRMQVRSLFVAACTLNATAIWTAKLLARGTLSMISQVRFFRKRWRVDPKDWGATAKSCFSRALSGHSLGSEGVCIDRHLERMGLAPLDAVAQWADWFRLYESLYGPGETVLCARWHVEVLDWIALRSGRPRPWK